MIDVMIPVHLINFLAFESVSIITIFHFIALNLNNPEDQLLISRILADSDISDLSEDSENENTAEVPIQKISHWYV